PGWFCRCASSSPTRSRTSTGFSGRATNPRIWLRRGGISPWSWWPFPWGSTSRPTWPCGSSSRSTGRVGRPNPRGLFQHGERGRGGGGRLLPADQGGGGAGDGHDLRGRLPPRVEVAEAHTPGDGLVTPPRQVPAAALLEQGVVQGFDDFGGGRQVGQQAGQV